jgi:hypothetical protein
VFEGVVCGVCCVMFEGVVIFGVEKGREEKKIV